VKTLAEDIGVSIWAAGEFQPGEAEGKKGRIVTALRENRFNTIDFVTYPGAGGEITQLFESAVPHESEPPAPNTTPQGEPNTMTEAEKALQGKVDQLTESTANMQKQLNAALLYPTARTAALKATEGLKLPAAAREKVVEAAAKAPAMKEDGTLDTEAFATQVKEAAEAEAAYLQESGVPLGSSNRSPVRGAGSTGVTIVTESAVPVPASNILAARSGLGLI
jgi:hypothetical protein